MIIAPEKVVSFHYEIKSPGGELLDASADGNPSVYLHGARNIFPMLERALAGKRAGDQVDVALGALEAFGPRREDLVRQIAVKHLHSSDRKLRPGSRALVRNSDTHEVVTVVKVGKFQATVDGNHPLAGQDVIFSVSIDAVRDATPDELAHGHAHGLDGSAGH